MRQTAIEVKLMFEDKGCVRLGIDKEEEYRAPRRYSGMDRNIFLHIFLHTFAMTIEKAQ